MDIAANQRRYKFLDWLLDNCIERYNRLMYIAIGALLSQSIYSGFERYNRLTRIAISTLLLENIYSGYFRLAK